MERSNQPPNTEGCPEKGEPVDLWFYRFKPERGSVPPGKREPQTGTASGLSNSASKRTEAGGDVVELTEPNMEAAVQGEAAEGLPGSKSVARDEGNTRNWGEPERSCRTNCESQAGKTPQRQEAATDDTQAVGLARSIQRQGASPEAEEGVNKLTQLSQATGPERMSETDWQTYLRAIDNKARQEPQYRFRDLYRQLNVEVLRLSFFRLRKDAASGVDGVSFQEYESNLEDNLKDLVRRLKNKAYRARLVRRKYIPKGNGKLRGLGIPALEDKLLQMAATQILLAIFEGDFLPCSYGYRVGRNAHDAIKVLTDELQWKRHHFLTEADIKGYFDHIQHDAMVKMLEQRIDDRAFVGLITKWLKAGILEEDGKVTHPLTGTPQGGVISPVLANIYLHNALDVWFEREFKPRQRGGCCMVRYADDFVVAFGYRHEAAAFEKEVRKRLAQYGLEVAEDKTKTIRFGNNGGEHNGRFDFLGFEFYWELDRKGRPRVKRRTASKRLRASAQRMTDWIRQNRHRTTRKLMRTLRAKLQGMWNYYGLIGNSTRMTQFYDQTCRTVHKWLNRRSQRESLTWKAFNRMLKRFDVPRPRIVENNQKGRPCQLELSLFERLATSLRPLMPLAHARSS
jgi:group II intron reverse transcriptase/maturase